MKKHCLFLGCMLFLLACRMPKKIDKKNNEGAFYLEVKQIVYGTYDQYSYIVTEGMIYIYMDYVLKSGIIERKRIYKKKLEPKVLETIKEMSFSLLGLKPEYIHATLGGVRWDVHVILDREVKKVIVENTTVSEIDNIFEFINLIIPNGKPHIYRM